MKMCISHCSLFPPNLLATSHNQSMLKTTNDSECFHHHLKDQFYSLRYVSACVRRCPEEPADGNSYK